MTRTKVLFFIFGSFRTTAPLPLNIYDKEIDDIYDNFKYLSDKSKFCKS